MVKDRWGVDLVSQGGGCCSVDDLLWGQLLVVDLG